jgi:putative sigma-54 modulation protein
MLMRIELTGRHVVVSPGLRNLVTRKLAKVERLLSRTGLSATVIVTTEKLKNVVEVTLHARGEHFLHAIARADTWATAMTGVVSKVLHQGERLKGKWQERKRRGTASRSAKTAKKARPAAVRKRAPARAGS